MKGRDILLDNETLFSREEAFSPEFVPEEILFRDPQIKEFAFSVKPLIRGSKASHTFLKGPTGTGKTTCAKHLFEEIDESVGNVITVHINCQMLPTQFKILAEVHKKLTGMLPPETGVPLTKVQDEIFSYLARKKKSLLVALDDIIPLFSGDTADKLLYSFLRAHETYPGVNVSVSVISTEDLLHLLDARVRTIFMPVKIEFHEYSEDELFSIIKERSRIGLYPGVITEELLRKISASTKDARVAIEILRKSAQNAESDASKKIANEHVKKALSSIIDTKDISVSEDEGYLLSKIKDKKEIESGDLFEIVSKDRGYSYSKFYRILQKLKNAKLISVEQIDKKRGKSSLIRKK